jgi:hypothetical protein
VTVSFTATDGTGVKEIVYSVNGGTDVVTSGASANAVISDEGVHNVSYFATDNAGNSSTPASVSVKIDKTAPVMSGSRSPGGNTYGWNNTPVLVTFVCNDEVGGSGVDSVTDPVTVSAEGENQSEDGNCTDKAGNGDSATVGSISIDNTDPVISGSRSPGANTYGWNNTPVLVTFVCNDEVGGSGVDSVTGPVTGSAEGENQSEEGNCTDKAGNGDSATVGSISIDNTDPVITAPVNQVVNATSAAGAVVSFNVSADFTISGSVSLDSSPADGSTFAVGDTTVTHTAVDQAGNSSSSTHQVTVLGAQGLSARAVAALTPFDGESKKIDKAIKEINKSMEKGFIDETHLDPKEGKKVFDHGKRAVKELQHVLKDEAKGKDNVSSAAAAAARQAIGDVVTADRLLARVQIETAQGATVVDPKNQAKVTKEIAKALTVLAKGDDKRSSGKYDKAMDDYKKAWEHTVHAMKEAEKPAKGKK